MRKQFFSATSICLMIATATVLSAAFVFIGSSQAAGSTYYVSTTGSNANPGTASQPWRTIQYAADTAGAGDTVVVQAGTYSERVNVNRGGTAATYTIFKANPARSVNLNGFELNAQYVKVEGFKVAGVSDIAFEVGASNLVIENNEVIENRSMGAGTWDPFANYANVVIKNNYVYRSAYGVVAAGDGWLVEGNEVERLIAYDDGDNDYMRFFGKNHVFRKNYLHGTRESEICRPGWTGPFDPNECAHVDGFQSFSNNNYTANNILFDGNFVVDFHQGATVQNNSGYMNISGLIFRNNVFVGGTSSTISASWGIQMNDLINTTIEHNYFLNVGGAIDMSRLNTGTIRNNIFNSAYGAPYVFEDQSNPNAVKGGNNINYKSNQNVWCWQCGSVSIPLPGDTLNPNIKMINPDNPLGADGKPFTDDDGYRLQTGSPAIDTGLASGVTVDIFGNSRPVGAKVDVGPHEFGLSSTVPPSTCTPNWSCTAWGICSTSGSQTRNCTDTNNCGVTTGKPSLSQACTPLPPTICTPNWSCTDWSSCSAAGSQSRVCTDINNCGKTTGRPVLRQGCTPATSYIGKLVRMTCSSREGSNDACRTVYFVANNGKRYAFPNERTFKTWYADFRSVQVLTFNDIIQLPLGGVVTSRPGARLVKFDTDPKVYAIARGGVLRWITSEALAKEMYGDRWNKIIDEIPTWFFTAYAFGSDINNSSDYNPESALAEVTNINIDKGL